MKTLDIIVMNVPTVLFFEMISISLEWESIVGLMLQGESFRSVVLIGWADWGRCRSAPLYSTVILNLQWFKFFIWFLFARVRLEIHDVDNSRCIGTRPAFLFIYIIMLNMLFEFSDIYTINLSLLGTCYN